MSCAEHYFENLLYFGKDVNGDVNKNQLTEIEQRTVEICAQYVIYSLFDGRDHFEEFLLINKPHIPFKSSSTYKIDL